ncbi:MAG: hemolysin family protein [Desulfurivibrionaceae bacterium]|nr:hemolysin family protein [Desulfobulbales bacterium]MDT8335726.1 hemolysin family protein [Desulfurivibrionaceae bacterium]
MLTQLVVAVGLAVIVSAICSVLEAVLYSVPNSYLEILQTRGAPSAPVLKSLKKDIHRPITAILTLNTIANTMGAAVAGAAAAAIFGAHNLVWFSVVFTAMILIFSEILPKTIGVAYCRELTPWIAAPLRIMVFLLKPVIFFCQSLTRLIPRHSEESIASAEEVMAIAAMGRRSGQIDPQEEMVISNILNLKNISVRDVMTPRTVTFALDEKMTVGEAVAAKDQWNLHSRIPIYRDEPDNISGIVLRNDVLSTAADEMNSIAIAVLAHPVHFVPETAPLSRILLDFIQKKQHLFVVVDEYGSMTGIISMEDIVEEIFGQEIMDESDRIKDMRALAKKRRKEKTA